MRFSPQFLDELRARLPVSEVVGRRVKLIKAGREWKGLSPFNKEKTPSFFVNDQKQAWFDFSSGKNGSIFDFIMITDGVGFPEAVERLAAMAGVPLPMVSEEEEAREEKRKTLHDVMELAAKFFEAQLASRVGAKARGYLADRALASTTQLKFRMGYAPGERYALKEHLGKEGVPVPDMIEAGLLIAGDDIPVPYDRFRDRVMFPIQDFRGRIIAFGGRALAADAQAKYLNSPETPLFHKGSNLYNGFAARSAVHDGAVLIVVEGYVDVIAMVTAGYPAAVAPLGTALTEEQLGILWKMADEPILCFDGDKAGQRAAYRAADLALPRLRPGKSLRFALLPEGQDPDDLFRSGGKEAIADVLDGARPLAAMLWAREVEASSLDTPERRAALEAKIKTLVQGIADESVRKYYGQDFEGRLRNLMQPNANRDGAGPRRSGNVWPGRFGDNARGGSQGWQRNRGPGGRLPPGREPLAQPSAKLSSSSIVRGHRTALPPREALILMAVINHPWLLEQNAEKLSALEFLNADADQLRRVILDAATGEEQLESEAIRAAVVGRGLSGVLARVEGAITHPSDWPARTGASPEDVGPWWTHVVALHHKQRTLNRELQDARRALGEELTDANLARLRDVQGELSALDGNEAQIEGFGLFSGRPARSV
ncbi:DNA primase [Rhodoplanes sp. Z2-YC6860]|uniref:DNA primase n=1 Tax=Rhodoplanes sp. Z2-YC6860 TaxID=674703 RepID=UPI00078C4F2A|nr:DNA primase [Rhodoplanes sp. Z2-YC6860]AMN40391.1 DNA primase [Rhodoplanes sp. Z2-YC6860]